MTKQSDAKERLHFKLLKGSADFESAEKYFLAKLFVRCLAYLNKGIIDIIIRANIYRRQSPVFKQS